MQLIAIQDANILIDLVKTGLFHHCLALRYRFTTTNIILDELYYEQVESIQPHITSGKFVVIEIADKELVEIQLMSLEDTRLSEQDWSALYYALQLDALLLTGDKRMRKLAAEKSITYCGLLWLLDQLVNESILTVKEACNFLRKLMEINNRLPADECELRIKQWCGQ